MNKKHIAFIACAVLLICLSIWAVWANTALEVTEYTIVSNRIPEAFSGFRIAQISDLHNAEFGENNSELIDLLRGTNPDIIVITGDLIDSRRTDVEVALHFCKSAVEIAPVYYVSGNHEARVSEYEALKKGLAAIGVTVLANEKVQISRGGENITLMGMDDPSFQTGYLVGDAAAVGTSSLSGLIDESDGYTLLLAHRPELFDTYVNAGTDLVFSGHAHGGQFRLPFAGGLIAPNQGFFPQYDAGLFEKSGTTMIVSRGVGNSIIPLRINNRPEIVVAEFL